MKLISILTCLTLLAPLFGCEMESGTGASVSEQMVIATTSPKPPPTTQTATVPAAEPPRGMVIATVNRMPIDRSLFLEKLIAAHGLPMLQQMILLTAAKQEAERRGLKVSPKDVDWEYELTLQADHMNGKDIEKLTPARREQMITEWVRSRGVSRTELQIAMERQTYLRKIVEQTVQITDEMVKQEYARAHGEKVEVRHIQLAALRVWPELKDRLDKGQRFEEMVLLYSQNTISRDRLGLMPPFSAVDETVPPVFAKSAFALKAGEYSNPIEVEGSYHVLKLERRIPADETLFESVRATLRKRLLSRKVVEAMQEMSSQLLLKCELRIDDPVLREEYRSLQASGAITGPPLAP